MNLDILKLLEQLMEQATLNLRSYKSLTNNLFCNDIPPADIVIVQMNQVTQEPLSLLHNLLKTIMTVFLLNTKILTAMVI